MAGDSTRGGDDWLDGSRIPTEGSGRGFGCRDPGGRAPGHEVEGGGEGLGAGAVEGPGQPSFTPPE